MKLNPLILIASAVSFSAVALAQTVTPSPAPSMANDTQKLAIANGIGYDLSGQTGDITFTKDGNFTGPGFAGTYKVDGDKICLTSDALGDQPICTVYPAGKKAGETFDTTSTMGDIKITINSKPGG